MENLRLESVWRDGLISKNWSERAANQFIYHLAQSTISQYNRYIANYSAFCHLQGLKSVSNVDSVVADYLCSLCDSSDRPKSILTANVAALNKYFSAVNMSRVGENIHVFVQALTKSGTKSPMLKTPVMPIGAFFSLFNDWPNNEGLSIKDLRLKAVCLLALVAMARPSDLAPKAGLFDHDTFEFSKVVLSTNQIEFSVVDMKLIFHGIKNDYQRDGFELTIPRMTAQDIKVDPVHALECYIKRTESFRAGVANSPLFVTLVKPYKALEASSISRILNEAIDRAGLGSKGFTAKCFRPTGATNAINFGLSPDMARYVGRWRCASTFEKHYVHTQLPKDYCEKMLKND